MSDGAHPLVLAVRPLLERLNASTVPVGELAEGDIALEWEGEVVCGVRLEGAAETGAADADAGGLGALLDALADELGAPLADLPRAEKQRAVRLLEERGAFSYRRSAETIAEALGVSRFTVYNYLNRQR